MIVGVLKKKKIIGSFPVASNEVILQYNNQLISDVEYPLELVEYIEQIPYE